MTQLFKKHYEKTIDQRSVAVKDVWEEKEILSCNTPVQNGDVFFTNGPLLTTKLVDLINCAQSTIIICSFLLASKSVEDAIDNAANRGVRVYLMLACESRLESTSDDDFGKMCEAQHISMLKRLAGKVMIRSASHYHAKIILIDALGESSSNAYGMLFTANFTEEALERNEELAVILNYDEIYEAMNFLKWAFWENAQHEMTNNEQFKQISPLNHVNYDVHRSHIVCTSTQERSIEDKLLKLIGKAKNTIIVSSFGFDENHNVINALCEKAQEGIKVIVLSRVRPSSMPALIQLKLAGATVLGFKWLHAKAILVDSSNGMVMSANLQHYGLNEGCEIGVHFRDHRVWQLAEILDHFIATAKFEFHNETLLKHLLGNIKLCNSKGFEELKIQERESFELKTITAQCASNLVGEPTISDTRWTDNPFHIIKYQWDVVAPILPKSAKEIMWEEEVKIPVVVKDFEKNGKKAQKNNGKQANEFEIKYVKHSYNPKVYKVNNQKMIAINGQSQLSDAIMLRNEKFIGANIVLSGA